jgi:hypothetical protein
MIFWRTYSNTLYSVQEVDKLGFPIEDPSFIPNQYLNNQEFIILRTCFGVGDWGIISAFPRKLKQRYPNCKVLIPSATLLESMFGQYQKNWSSWENPFKVVNTIFDNNPYVDGYIDSFEGEVFNDHFRIYDGDKDEPLLKQILRFWQFDTFEDIQPELYFSEEEKILASKIIQDHCSGEFGTLLISNRYTQEGSEKIQSILDKFNLPMFYWTREPDTGFKFIKALDMRHINIRIQMLIKTMATFNVGNQAGVNDTVVKYAPTYTVPRGKLGSNFVEGQIYL